MKIHKKNVGSLFQNIKFAKIQYSNAENRRFFSDGRLFKSNLKVSGNNITAFAGSINKTSMFQKWLVK